MLRALFALELQVSEVAKAENPANELRCYPWRPVRYPELPAIWNWIDDGSVEVPDTARIDDVIVVTATIGVAPTNPDEDIDRLVVLTDHFRHVVDPALKTRTVLPDPDWIPEEHDDMPAPATARAARRLLTRTSVDEFDEAPVMCMDMLIRVDLARIVNTT